MPTLRSTAIKRVTFLRGAPAAVALALLIAWAADPTASSAVYSGDEAPPKITLATYRSISSSQSRNYDRTQDISPRQMTILLEVSERTGASLGQALATGELESAHTWNDYVRPTLKSGNLGSATGVWQFQPATFHSIVKKFGAQLLAASRADASLGRDAMDLGDGPFTDTQVRSIIRETVDGTRGADNEELQLLRHNFAVLAFAKHYLSVDSGAATPEEDYLFHFLGAGLGKRVLALARGDARDTLCVKPFEMPAPSLDIEPGLLRGDGIVASVNPKAALEAMPPIAAEPTVKSRIAPDAFPPLLSERGLEPKPKRSAKDRIRAFMEAEALLQTLPAVAAEASLLSPFASDAPPPMSSEWGLAANSPTVTGNLGMFYRDGKGQTQPYTWAEFMENLARRVKAESQPALVRAKYGVGFALPGGDMPERTFNPDKATEAAKFLYENDRILLVPEAMVTGPLGDDETEQYRQRLAALSSQGDDEPTETLPPETLSALHHLRMLSPKVQETDTAHPEVRKALSVFRKAAGKDEPDNPAHRNRLMPAERIALEIYDRRLARYAALQACQEASSAEAPDLNRIRKMPAGVQRLAAPHIAELQTALAAQGLLTQPIKKFVWRDKKRKKHVDYKRVPFAGKADKATVAALEAYQWRNGLRKTQGVLDSVTLEMLGLSPMGPDMFLPLSGPQCAIATSSETPPMCETPSKTKRISFVDRLPIRPRWLSRPGMSLASGTWKTGGAPSG